MTLQAHARIVYRNTDEACVALTIVSILAKALRERPMLSGVKKVAATGMGSLMPECACQTLMDILIPQQIIVTAMTVLACTIISGPEAYILDLNLRTACRHRIGYFRRSSFLQSNGTKEINLIHINTGLLAC